MVVSNICVKKHAFVFESQIIKMNTLDTFSNERVSFLSIWCLHNVPLFDLIHHKVNMTGHSTKNTRMRDKPYTFFFKIDNIFVLCTKYFDCMSRCTENKTRRAVSLTWHLSTWTSLPFQSMQLLKINILRRKNGPNVYCDIRQTPRRLSDSPPVRIFLKCCRGKASDYRSDRMFHIAMPVIRLISFACRVSGSECMKAVILLAFFSFGIIIRSWLICPYRNERWLSDQSKGMAMFYQRCLVS